MESLETAFSYADRQHPDVARHIRAEHKTPPGTQPTVDHIIPRRDGGTNTLKNYVIACRQCNEDKGHKARQVSGHVLAKWRKAVDKYLQEAKLLHNTKKSNQPKEQR